VVVIDTDVSSWAGLIRWTAFFRVADSCVGRCGVQFVVELMPVDAV